jgi:hypothetical protein
MRVTPFADRSFLDAVVLTVPAPHVIIIPFYFVGPPLWSSGQSSWPQIQRSRVRFPALPDFLRNSGSGTGSTQPREDNWGTISRKQRLRSRKPKLTTVGYSLRWPRDTLYALNLALTSPTSGGCSLGIVRWPTEAPEFVFVCFLYFVFLTSAVTTWFSDTLHLCACSFFFFLQDETQMSTPYTTVRPSRKHIIYH